MVETHEFFAFGRRKTRRASCLHVLNRSSQFLRLLVELFRQRHPARRESSFTLRLSRLQVLVTHVWLYSREMVPGLLELDEAAAGSGQFA